MTPKASSENAQETPETTTETGLQFLELLKTSRDKRQVTDTAGHPDTMLTWAYSDHLIAEFFYELPDKVLQSGAHSIFLSRHAEADMFTEKVP